jgi:hypothetical protein
MFEKLLRNIFDFYPTLIQLPVTYIGNKYLNIDSEYCVTNKKLPYNPYCLINSIRANYDNKFKRANRMRIYNKEIR